MSNHLQYLHTSMTLCCVQPMQTCVYTVSCMYWIYLNLNYNMLHMHIYIYGYIYIYIHTYSIYKYIQYPLKLKLLYCLMDANSIIIVYTVSAATEITLSLTELYNCLSCFCTEGIGSAIRLCQESSQQVAILQPTQKLLVGDLRFSLPSAGFIYKMDSTCTELQKM